MTVSPALDLDAFRGTPLTRDPFDHLVVPSFVRREALAALEGDFPVIDKAGSFPPSVLVYGPAFAALLRELEGPAMTAAVAEKFDIDLAGRPTMVTVRGQSRARDGLIHVDSRSKLITVLLYMNSGWDEPGGRLRLLRSPDLDDIVAEVPPEEGTLLAFRNTENAWHGHSRFIGPRRTIQLNWVTDDEVVRREQARHTLSSRIKRLNPFA